MMSVIPSRPNSSRLLGDLPDYKKDPLNFWLSLGDIAPTVKIRFANAERIVINDPDIAQHILQKNYGNYIKDQRLKKILEMGTGPIMTTSDGADWQWRRKLMQPTFKRGAIIHFADDMISHTKRMMESWEDGSAVDVAEAMKTLTMNIIGQTMFSVDFDKDAGDLHHAYTKFGQGLVRRATRLVQIPLSIPTKANRKFTKAVTTMKTALAGIITERRETSEQKNDLLNMLLTFRLEDDAHRFTEDQLLHEMSAIVFAGHETTATSLTWVFALLAQHKDIYDHLMQEIDGTLQGRTPRPEDAKDMPYLEQVIDEAMRLYPPLYINSRQSVGEDNLGVFALPTGSRMLINIVGIHRNKNYWQAPESFDPDRFVAEKKRDQHSFAHIPFLKGPRICIGSTFALMELKIIIPMILQKYKLSLTKPGPVEAEADVVLQPKGGLPMKLSKRD